MNNILEAYLVAKGIAAEDIFVNYTPFGHSDWAIIVSDVVALAADGEQVDVISTINGDANIGFYKELAAQGVTADAIPVVAFSVGEEELSGLDTSDLVGHLAAWNYFMSADTEENAAFIEAFRTFTGNPDRVTNDPTEAHYIGFNMWVNAVEAVGSTDVHAVIDALATVLTASQPLAAQEKLQDILQSAPEEMSDPLRRTVGETLDRLLGTGHPDLALFLERWRAREVVQRNADGLFFYAGASADGVALIDIDTGEEVGVPGSRAVSPLRPNAGVQGEIGTALSEFQLTDPDIARRSAAVAAIAEVNIRVGAFQIADVSLDALSLASICFLAAIGLAITFGVMASSTWPTASSSCWAPVLHMWCSFSCPATRCRCWWPCRSPLP